MNSKVYDTERHSSVDWHRNPRSTGVETELCIAAKAASLGQCRNKVKARQNTDRHIVCPRGDEVGQVAAKKMKRNTPCCRAQRSAVHDMPTRMPQYAHSCHRIWDGGRVSASFDFSIFLPPRTPYTGYRTGTTSAGTDHPLAWGPLQSIVLERKDDANWRS